MKFLLLLFLAASSAFGALPATGIINMRSTATANNLNGGGFNTARGGTDYSLQDAAQLTRADGTAAGTTNFASVLGGFTAAMVGNYIHLTASTGLTLGWYEITARVDTNNVTLDRSPGTGSATTFYVGGALSFVGTTITEDAVLEIGVAGNIFYLKNGSYTIGDNISTAAAGSTSSIIQLLGYNSTPGDAPTGSTRPTIDTNGGVFRPGAYWRFGNLIVTGSTSAVLDGSVNETNTFVNCKVVNNSTTANRIAIAAGREVVRCEAVSYRGIGLQTGYNTALSYNYIHDSNVGINFAANGSVRQSGIGNLIVSCVTKAIDIDASHGGVDLFQNTIYGAVNKLGVGVTVGATNGQMVVMNNIISGFTTGVTANALTVQNDILDDYNDYYNNTTDNTNWNKGSSSSAVNPSFTSVTQVTGSTATTTSGNHLVQSGATFVTSGVTAGRDYVYIVSGTGVTAGVYGILSVDSETQITADITLAANATADKVFQITVGRNFAIGTAMKALGFPGAMPGATSTGYQDQGAIPRQESGGQSSRSQ